MNTAVTYIVSAFNRSHALRCCLASIQCQTDGDWYVIVADNGTGENAIANRRIVDSFEDSRINRIHIAPYSTGPQFDCYWSAEAVVEHVLPFGPFGEYLVLPSDDSYYVPVFQETMLGVARANDLGLVYCDMLYDRRGHGKYHHKIVAPRVCEIDKTCFMLRRDCWIGFPNKPTEPKGSSCDGEMIEQLVRNGIRHGRVDEMLVIHN